MFFSWDLVFFVTCSGNWQDRATLNSNWFTFWIKEYSIDGEYESGNEVQLSSQQAETFMGMVGHGEKLIDCCDCRGIQLIEEAKINPPVYTFGCHEIGHIYTHGIYVYLEWWAYLYGCVSIGRVYACVYMDMCAENIKRRARTEFNRRWNQKISQYELEKLDFNAHHKQRS